METKTNEWKGKFDMKTSESQIAFFASFIESKLGIVYTKDNFYQLEKRLLDIATQLNLSGIEELHATAQIGMPVQMRALILDLSTNNETSFYRDAGLFKAIEDHILPEARWSGDHPEPLRIWCAATSTGQEVYSLAILLNVWQQKNSNRKFTFFATDYSTRVLQQAQQGVYSQLEVQRGLPSVTLARYFHNQSSEGTNSAHAPKWAVNDELKRNITFKQLNLLDDWGPIGPFDIVLCRNVLIYQNIENKKKVIAEIHKRMAPGGHLILGAAESLMGLSNDFTQIEYDRTVMYKKSNLELKKVV